MPKRVKDVIKDLEKDGWEYIHTKGSHRKYRHHTKIGRVIVPGHLNDEVPRGLLTKIYKDAGLERNW